MSRNISSLLPVRRTSMGFGFMDVVDARFLHSFLQVQTAFRDWITRRIEEFGFEEDQDFRSFLGETSGGRPPREYMLSLDMAKELAMVERNARGKEARLYFIACERRALGEPVQQLVIQVPRTLAQALRLAADQADQLEQQAAHIEVLQPKAAFHDAGHDAQGAQSIREVAQVLGTGQNRLFAWLRAQRILLENNLPYQEHVDAGRFKVVETTWTDRDNCTHPVSKTLVTGKGLTWLQGKWQAWKAGEGLHHAEVG